MKTLTVAAVAIAASVSAFAAHAQRAAPPPGMAEVSTPGAQQQMRDRMVTLDNNRIANDLSNMAVTDRRGRKLNPGQVLNAAKTAASANGLSCKVTEAALRGVTNDNNDLWEVACDTGPGYVITSPGKTQPIDCSVVAAQIAQMKADGLTPPPGSACALKGNQPKP